MSLIIIVVYAYIAYEYLSLGVSNWAGLLLLNAGFALVDMRGFLNNLLNAAKIT